MKRFVNIILPVSLIILILLSPTYAFCEGKPVISDEDMNKISSYMMEDLKKELDKEAKLVSFLESFENDELEAYGISSRCKTYRRRMNYWSRRMDRIVAANKKLKAWALCGVDRLPRKISGALAMGGAALSLTKYVAIGKAQAYALLGCVGAYGASASIAMIDMAVSVAIYKFYEKKVKKHRC